MLAGHDKQKKYFDKIIKNGSLGHAYLFFGPEMIGKKTFALELYSLLNDLDFNNDPDFRLIAPRVSDDESKMYIEDIRNLKSFFSLKPYRGPYKFAVIDDAHCLTTEAANALLKVLEEPPSFSVIILVSAFPGLLLPTIKSRCEDIKFVPVSENEMSDHLDDYKKINKEDKDFLVKLSGGRIGMAKNILETGTLAETKKAIDDLRRLFKASIWERMEYARKLNEKGDYGKIVNFWLYWVGAHVAGSPKNQQIVKNLLSLNNLTSQPQFNHRLALENFLINL